jgi:hypothetical protein
VAARAPARSWRLWWAGAPPGWIGRRVSVQWDVRHVRLLNPSTGQLLREHLRATRGRHRIQDPRSVTETV